MEFFSKKDSPSHEWISMSEAASFTPYSAEYLSLLARKKKLAAKKVGKTWYTTRATLEEYMKRQMIRNQVQMGDMHSVAHLVSPGTDERSKTFINDLVSTPDQREAEPAPVASVAAVEKTEPAVEAPREIEEAALQKSEPAPMVISDDVSLDHPLTGKLRTYQGDLKKYLDSLSDAASAPTSSHLEHVHMPKSVSAFKELFSPKKQVEAVSEESYQAVTIRQLDENPVGATLPPRVEPPATFAIRPPVQPVAVPVAPPQPKNIFKKVAAIVSPSPEKKIASIATSSQLSSIEKTLMEIEKRLDAMASAGRSGAAAPAGSVAAELSRVLDEKLPLYAGMKRSFDNILSRSFKTVGSNKALAALALAGIMFFTIFPTPFVFAFFEKTVAVAKEAWNDANTVMGFRPGTHENEILLLDKAGNVSIMGHIETEGQLRSYIADGIAPIVVDSKTLVKNLNAEYVGGNRALDFTLAFVTKNGNVTTEDVHFEGSVEVGKTLLVRGATKLLSALRVEGDLTVLGDANFARSLSVEGPAYFRDLAASGVVSAGALVSNGNLNVGKNGYFRGSLEVRGDVLGRNGSFKNLGVTNDFSAGGEIELGNPSDTLTIDSKNITLDVDGNLALDGNATIAGTLTSNASFTNGTSTTANLSVTSLAIINSLSASSSVMIDATTTNAFISNATTTNSYVTNLTADNSTTTNLFSTNSSSTNATSTNLFSVNASTTNATSTNLFSTNASTTNATSTNLFAVNASTTNATSTSFFSSILHALAGTIDTLIATIADINSLTAVNSTTTYSTTT
ncbi:MAG: nucleoporin, partial [Candidatus Paceibacterota bacterium]